MQTFERAVLLALCPPHYESTDQFFGRGSNRLARLSGVPASLLYSIAPVRFLHPTPLATTTATDVSPRLRERFRRTARSAAASSLLVLVGSHAALALGVPARPYGVWRRSGSALFATIPHPSPMTICWREPEVRESGERLLRGVVARTADGTLREWAESEAER